MSDEEINNCQPKYINTDLDLYQYGFTFTETFTGGHPPSSCSSECKCFENIPWGGGVREVILISGQNQNCPFLKTDSLADTFFWTKNVQKNVKYYGEKVLENFLTLKKKVFLGHFF